MKLRIYITLAILLGFIVSLKAQEGPISKEDFSNINLTYHGLERVNQRFQSAKYDDAAKELLLYYRNRKKIRHPEFNIADEQRFKGKSIGAANQEKADNALLHKFQPHKGYGFFDYGKDINWQLWPVKDNEVRWQLHRVYWWQTMGLAYRSSGDERYAAEWVYQFRDWVKKNPLGLSADNDAYAWRPLEVSERVQSLPGTFNLFLSSTHFTPAFLMEFLKSFHQQADYIPQHYSKEGNHLLFEAQRVLFAGAFFPEFKESPFWRKSGIDILNTEIKKQVYADGVQFELSPVYHIASIDIFLKAYNAAKMAGVESEFPETFSKTIEHMIMANIDFSFPDYNAPMFGDSWIANKSGRIKQYQNWAKIFPENKVIQYFATEGKEGALPDHLSHASSNAGFYTFRNGWNDKSTVMVLKASPPGEFHAQPDNGTFELYVKGRNFMPDAGAFVYSGDAEIDKLREQYRQTKMHNTLTLDDQNMVITNAKQNKWKTGKMMDVLTFTNPSYKNLDHQRTVLFIDQKYFIIIDRAIGSAKGKLDIRFHLKEDAKPIYYKSKHLIYTTYGDGNNLLIQLLNPENTALLEEQSKVSYEYRKEMTRPAVAFQKQKIDAKTPYFISVVYPFTGTKAPEITMKENTGNDFVQGKIDFELMINGKSQNVKTNINQ
ncbi:heparin-sulfate lyase HepC [Pedobacter sp. Leaf132]|uniref:heparin-sulfate lyase HepC n=1 Tax=Pedobacter sp. Leaf132 TaxID=2876557 RepID=UPI001E5094F2|nr:heparin-sulfate lyase HepC [Pedobacter sp. Leaf132]